MPWISSANITLSRELAAPISIQWSDLILFNIGCALAPVENIIGRKMNEGYLATPRLELRVETMRQR